jgi:hypothetical protein
MSSSKTLKPSDFPSPQAYFRALKSDREMQRRFLFEDAFKLGWSKILPLDEFYRAQKSAFDPLAHSEFWHDMDEALADGTETAKRYSKRIHSEVA